MTLVTLLSVLLSLTSVVLASSTSLNGTVYYDCNSNGVYDRNELPFSNAKIELSDVQTGKNISSTVSSPSGSFSFTVAQKETYRVCATLPRNSFFFTVPVTGCITVSVASSPVTGLLIGASEVLAIIAPSNRTVSCTATLSPAQLGSPTVRSCPTSTVVTSFSDVVSVPCLGSEITTRTWTATVGMNSVSAVQMIQSDDNQAPQFVDFPPPAQVECLSCYDPSATGAPTAEDACSAAISTVTFTDTPATGTTCARLFQREWKAQDSCLNYMTQHQIIRIVDTKSPKFTFFPADVSVQYGTSTAPNVTGTPISTDECSTNTISYSDVSNRISTGTLIQRTWTATDACSNSVSQIQKITVLNA